MLKIFPLCTALLAMPVAVTIIKPHGAPAKPVAFHVTSDLIPTKISAAKQAGNTDTASLKNSSWYAEAMRNVAKKEYEFKPVAEDGMYVTPNRQNNLSFTYSDKGFTVKPHTTKIPVDQTDPSKPVEEIKYKTLPNWQIAFNLNKEQIGEGQWQVTGNKAEYVTGNITVQYINNEEGMRQNFIVKEPTVTGADEKIVLDIATTLKVKVQPNGLQFTGKQGVVMSYDQLKVWDANGQPLEATFEKSSRDYCIHVQSKNAVYPITIDPLSSAVTTLKKSQASAQMGYSVSSAGDVNGDGYSDVIVGAPYYSNDQTSEGAAFIYYGSATGIKAASSVMLDHNQANSGFGWSVSGGGDVNGDGYSDVIVGAPLYELNGNGAGKEGVVAIYYGSATGIDNTVRSIFGLDNYYFPNAAQFGYSVSTAGDINADGYSDMIVGAPFYDTGDQGGVFIYRGGPGGMGSGVSGYWSNYYHVGEKLGTAVACAGDVNSDGYSDVITGIPYNTAGYGGAVVHHGSASGINFTGTASSATGDQGSSNFGFAVAGAGDVNGDGYGDVIVGAPNYHASVVNEGMVEVWFGSATGIGASKNRLYIGATQAQMGRSVASAGDVNGDGYCDILVGTPYHTTPIGLEGAAFIYYGTATGVSSGYSSPVGTGGQVSAFYGWSLASAGDVNGDGYSDVIVGCPQLDNPATDEGTAFVYHGSPLGINNTAGWYVEGNVNEGRMGHSVAYAGDVNGDGYGDVVIGMPGYTNGQPYEGIIFVYHGTATGLSGSPAITIELNVNWASFGWSVASAGDVNGDGYDDIIIGAVNYSNGNATEGMFRIYHGSASGITSTPAITVEGNQDNAQMGISVACAGDVNGDGYSDVIVGANGYTNGQANEGVAFVYHGSATGISATYAALLERNQAGSSMGTSVAGAGDVNGDGFSDVLVGATRYTNDQTNEGAVFFYKGSATGINTATPVRLEGIYDYAQYGSSIAGGDINGDGYSDVVVGSTYYNPGGWERGALYIYHGSATGISTTATLGIEGSAGSWLGNSVRLGDVNGDGYSDVIAGAFMYGNGQGEEGAIEVYHGSATGITSLTTRIESNVESVRFGYAVGVGDFNADGYSDVIVGAPELANGGLTTEGAVYAYYGNSPKLSKRNNLNLYSDNLTTNITRSNVTSANFGIGLFAKSFLGRIKGKLVWETSRSYNAFSGSPITNSVLFTAQQASYSDLGTAGTELKGLVGKFFSSKYTRVRARVKYDPVTAYTGQVYSPWRYAPELVAGLSLGALPVDLISFKAEWLQKGSSALIKFITDNEDGVCCYEVEKSLNGVQFTTLGKLTAKNTGTRNNYSYTDNNATAQKQYYRLKTIFQDGSVEYSNLQWLQTNAATEVIVFPNPASTTLQLRLNNNYTSMNVQIMNAAGQTIQQYANMSTAGSVVTIPVSSLAAGTYFLYLQSGSEKQVLQFMKK